MTYAIFDSGNLVVSYNDYDRALNALSQLAQEDESSAHEIAMIALDDHGDPVGDAVLGTSRIPHAV